MLKRTAVALVFGPVVLVGFYLGGFVLFAMLELFCLGLIYEFAKVFPTKIPIWRYALVFLLSSAFMLAATTGYLALGELFSIAMLALLLAELIGTDVENAFVRTGATVFLTVYAGMLFSSLAQVTQYGSFWGIFPCATVWTVDSFAYWGGSLMGRHKLAPKVSPNKTVEGFLWGFASAFLTAFVALRFFAPSHSSAVWFVAFAAGTIGQFGDLFESKLKRCFGVKDMGSFFPGHGGFWDRTDSLIWIYTVTWIILRFYAS